MREGERERVRERESQINRQRSIFQKIGFIIKENEKGRGRGRNIVKQIDVERETQKSYKHITVEKHRKAKKETQNGRETQRGRDNETESELNRKRGIY